MENSCTSTMRERPRLSFIPIVTGLILVAGILTAGAAVVATDATAAPVYSAAVVKTGLTVHPAAWVGRTVLIQGRVMWLGGSSVWLTTNGTPQAPRHRHLAGGAHPGQWIPFTQIQQQSLPLTPGSWQTPSFPRNLVWWLNSNMPGLSGIDGGRVEAYRITLTKRVQASCPTCPVGHG